MRWKIDVNTALQTMVIRALPYALFTSAVTIPWIELYYIIYWSPIRKPSILMGDTLIAILSYGSAKLLTSIEDLCKILSIETTYSYTTSHTYLHTSNCPYNAVDLAFNGHTRYQYYILKVHYQTYSSDYFTVALEYSGSLANERITYWKLKKVNWKTTCAPKLTPEAYVNNTGHITYVKENFLVMQNNT